MTKQSEALRLADLLDAVPFLGFVFDEQQGMEDPSLAKEAAAELRRLHEVNQELLEALLRMMRHIPADFGGASFSDDWWKAQRIIAKATGEH